MGVGDFFSERGRAHPDSAADPDTSLAFLGSIVESSGDAIIGLTLDGLIISWNAAATRIFGLSRDDATGRPITLLITSESVAKPSGGEVIPSKGLQFHYNAIDGLKVLTWSDRGLTYALVSDLEERGQKSCIVCHQGTKDQDFMEPLKTH